MPRRKNVNEKVDVVQTTKEVEFGKEEIVVSDSQIPSPAAVRSASAEKSLVVATNGTANANAAKSAIISESESSSISISNKRESEGEGESTDAEVSEYIRNCRELDIIVDASVVIALKTRWSVLAPAKSFAEGALLPLMDILKRNATITRFNFSSSAMYDSRYRSYGSGNSNARILRYILESNHRVEELNLSNTGLSDDGVSEIAEGIKKNTSLQKINLSYNNFGEVGAEKLREALLLNNSIRHVDLSNNALGFSSISALVCACRARRVGHAEAAVILTNGNYVFEEILNSVSHGVCFLVSIVGACLLISEAADEEAYSPFHFWSCVLYSFCAMFLFLSSCLFHSFFMLPQVSHILQILDHIGISFLIAGSYTPFLLVACHDSMIARVLVCCEWIAALFAAGFAAISDLNAPATSVVELSVFALMGVGPVFFWSTITANLSSGAITLYLVGGLTYLAGIPFFILGEVHPKYHVIWHLFVATGACLHWFLVYIFILNTDIGPMGAVVSDVIKQIQNVSHF